MAVKIGSARGQSLGSSAIGDHTTGKEVSTENYYVHKKGWVVYRAKDARLREYMAECMEKACANQNVGYSQPQRLYLLRDSKEYNYDPSMVKINTSCDCSSLVRVCIFYALKKCGYDLDKYAPKNFTTDTETYAIMATGLFEKLTDDAHCKSSTYLARGDILNTKTKGHTVIVLTNGSKCDASNSTTVVVTEDTTTAPPSTAILENALTITGNTVNIRFGCGTKYNVYKVAKLNEKYEKADIGGWIPIKYDNTVRFISAKYVEGNKVTGSVYIRKGVTTLSETVGVLSRNSNIEVVDTTGWTPILIGTCVYWVSNKYVK